MNSVKGLCEVNACLAAPVGLGQQGLQARGPVVFHYFNEIFVVDHGQVVHCCVVMLHSLLRLTRSRAERRSSG